VVANGGAGKHLAFRSKRRQSCHDHAGMEQAAIANLDLWPYEAVGTDLDIRSDPGGWVDERRLMDPRHAPRNAAGAIPATNL
jgi:hypothetical protein